MESDQILIPDISLIVYAYALTDVAAIMINIMPFSEDPANQRLINWIISVMDADILPQIALFWACANGDLGLVKSLMQIRRQQLTKSEQRQIFTVSCERGHLDVLKYISAVFKATDEPMDWNPHDLDYICRLGRADVAKWAGSSGGLVPLETVGLVMRANMFYNACEKGHLALAKWLFPHDGYPADREMEVACMGGHVDVVDFLVRKCAIQPGDPRTDNTDPLWYAAKHGHLKLIKWLAATLKLTKKSFKRMLIAAYEMGEVETARWIVSVSGLRTISISEIDIGSGGLAIFQKNNATDLLSMLRTY